MLNEEFSAGPFVIVPGRTFSHNGHPLQTLRLEYLGERLGEVDMPVDVTRATVIFELRSLMHPKRVELQDRTPLHLIQYVTPAPGSITDTAPTPIGSFWSTSRVLPGMSPVWAGDSAPAWVISEKPTHAMPADPDDYAKLRAQHEAAPLAWVAALLDDDVLTLDPKEWRVPTEFELRLVIGEHSFTGVSGAKAADLVGVTPQNFRKYTARNGAVTRQNMSFAMWHLLLHRLGVCRLRT